MAVDQEHNLSKLTVRDTMPNDEMLVDELRAVVERRRSLSRVHLPVSAPNQSAR